MGDYVIMLSFRVSVRDSSSRVWKYNLFHKTEFLFEKRAVFYLTLYNYDPEKCIDPQTKVFELFYLPGKILYELIKITRFSDKGIIYLYVLFYFALM